MVCGGATGGRHGPLFMQEDDSFDAEVWHTTDLVSLLDFTQADGFLFA